MAIYTAILPNGQPYKIRGPEGASTEDIQAAGEQIYLKQNRTPYVDSGERDYSLGTAGSKAVSRGMERVKSTFGDVIPAMVGNVFGADEYVKRQMYEAEASQDLINRKYRAELQSYKDVQGLGDAIKFGVETIGEQVANLGVMAIPGVAAGQVAKIGASKLAVGALAKRQATAQGIGVYLGSYALNAPEVFQNIYQETGELSTGTSLLFGAAAASLDSILPATILKKITPLQKLGIAKAVIKKSGARPGLVESVFKGLAKGASVEGVTEGMQEAISISAENFVAGNPQIFESEDWDRIMESSVRGAVAGGGFRGVSSPFERPAAEPKPLTRAELENQRFVAEEAAAAEVAAAAAEKLAKEKLAKEKPAKEKPAKEKPAPAAEVTPKVEIEQAAELELPYEGFRPPRGMTLEAGIAYYNNLDGIEQINYEPPQETIQDEPTTIDAVDRTKTIRGGDALPLESVTRKTTTEPRTPVGGKVEVDTGTVSPTGERADVSDVALSPENITAEQQWDDMSVSGVPFNALKKEDQLRLTEAQQDGELTGQLVDEIDSAAAQTFAGLTFVKEGEKHRRYKAKEGFVDKDGRPQGGKEFIDDFYRQDEMRPVDEDGNVQESRTAPPKTYTFEGKPIPQKLIDQHRKVQESEAKEYPMDRFGKADTRSSTIIWRNFSKQQRAFLGQGDSSLTTRGREFDNLLARINRPGQSAQVNSMDRSVFKQDPRDAANFEDIQESQTETEGTGQVYYRGTSEEFDDVGGTGGVIYLSPNRAEAEQVGGSIVTPYRLKVKNTFDINNKAHLKKVLAELSNEKPTFFKGRSYKNSQREIFKQALEDNPNFNFAPYEIIEEFAEEIEGAGFDSFFVQEQTGFATGAKNIGVFNASLLEPTQESRTDTEGVVPTFEGKEIPQSLIDTYIKSERATDRAETDASFNLGQIRSAATRLFYKLEEGMEDFLGLTFEQYQTEIEKPRDQNRVGKLERALDNILRGEPVGHDYMSQKNVGNTVNYKIDRSLIDKARKNNLLRESGRGSYLETKDIQESRTETEGTGQTAATVLADLVKEFGNNVNKMIEKGKLVIVDNVSQLPANITMSSTANGAFDNNSGISYLVADRIQKGQARRVLLHEIGEHYGLEKMVGKDYMPMLNRLKTLRKQNADVDAIFAQVQEQYPEFEVDSKPFLQEVMAKLGEKSPNNTLFRRMVGAVKNFLRRLGLYNVNNFNDADIQDMILNSLRVSLAEATGTVTREQVSGMPALQMSEEVEATAGVDIEHVRKLLGSNIYGKANTAAVTIKELLQNAADSLKGLLAKGTIEDGRIDITIGRPFVMEEYENVNRVISMKDNGTGMTPETLSTTFITTGGSDKEANASGGLGVAKEQFLFAAKSVNVVTMRDGVITELVSTGKELNNSANKRIRLPRGTIRKYSPKEYSDLMIEKEEARTGEKFRIYNNELNIDNFQPYMRLFPKGQGTIVEIEVPNFYREEDASGNVVEKEIEIEGFLSDYPELENSPLFATSPDGNVVKKSNIDVTFQGFSASRDLVPIGANFPTEDYATNIDVEFSWGSAKIIVSKEEVKYPYPSIDKNVIVLSNGLYQFEDVLRISPKEKGYGELIQRKFFIDIKSKIQPGEKGYPFANNRQSLTPAAKQDLEKIENYLQKEFGQLQLTNQFNSVVNTKFQILRRQKDGSIRAVDIPSLAKAVEKNAQDIIEETQDLKVTEAGELVNRKTNVPVLTAKEMEEVQVSAEGLQIEKGIIPTDEVIIHDNLETLMRDIGEDQPSVNLKAIAEYVPITQLAREKFGSRFDTFMNEIGEAFLLLRNQVIMLGNLEKGQVGKLPRDYNKLADNVVGISFDVSFRGVNIGGVPFEGVFVNPGAIEFTNSPEEASQGMFTTMIHEMAHFYEKDHEVPFTQEIARLANQLEAAGMAQKPLLSGKKPKLRSTLATKKALAKSIRDNEDIFKFLNSINQPGEIYDYGKSKQQIRPIGERFETSDLEVRDERVTENIAETREQGRAGPERVSRDTRKRDTTEQRERQPESVSPESKTTQESRVDTSDVAEIIDYGGVDRGQAKGVLNTINTTIKKLGLADTAAGKFILDKLSLVPAYLAEGYVSLLSIPNKIELFAKELPALKKIATYLQNKAHDIKIGREQVNVLLEDAKVLREQYNKTQKGQKIWTEWNTVLFNLSKENINPETIINDPEARAELERPISKDAAGNEFYNDKGIALIERYEKLPKDLRDLGKLVALDLKTRYELLLDTMVKAYPSAETQLREKFTTLDYYLPMVRKGDHWFKYITKDGEEGKASATSPFLREQMKKKLREQDATQFENFSQQELAQVSGGAPAAFVENIKSAILKNEKVDKKSEAAVLETIEEQYLALFPEQSLRNQETHRKGIPGYINDIMFAYADTAPKIIASTANAKYNADIIKASNEVSEDAVDSENAIVKAIGKDTIKSVPFYLNPVANPWAAMPAYVSYVWFLGGNISSAFVNLTQLPLIVLPFLQGEYTFDKSQKALFDAIKLYTEGGFEENRVFLPDRTAAPFKLDPKTGEKIYTGKNAKLFVKGGRYYQLFKDAEQAAALRRGVGYEITELRKNLGEEVKSGTRIKTKVDAAVGYVFQNSERINREVTLMAAFDLEMKYGSKNEAKAIQKAIELTSKVHSHSLPEMGPRLFQDGLGKVTFVFKRFAQAQVYLAGKLFKDVFGAKPKNKEEREARDIAARQLIGVYGYSFLMAGVQGMPFYGAATVLASLLFDDEDEPFDPHTVVNQAIGDIAYRGPLSQLMGVDISQRTGFRDLVFREDPARLEKIGAASYMLEVIGGPGFSIVRKGFEGMGMVANGEIGRGAERMLPTALANTIKTVRYNTDGMTNRYGAPIIEGDPSVYESFMQILGFTNIELSEAYTEANALKGPERKLQQRKSRLLLKYFLAKQTGDAGGMESIQKEIDSFNNKAPASFKITPSVRNRSMKAREKKLKDSVHGVYQGANIRAELEEKYLNN